MQRLKGGCQCGNIIVDLEFQHPPETCEVRVCDCEFCRKRNAAYVSDPQGSMVVWIRDRGRYGSYRQGSGQAEFLSCTNCGVLIGSLYRNGGHVYATVNARCVRGEKHFAAEHVMSPRNLNADEKIQRWRALWFGRVTLITGEPVRTRT